MYRQWTFQNLETVEEKTKVEEKDRIKFYFYLQVFVNDWQKEAKIVPIMRGAVWNSKRSGTPFQHYWH